MYNKLFENCTTKEEATELRTSLLQNINKQYSEFINSLNTQIKPFKECKSFVALDLEEEIVPYSAFPITERLNLGAIISMDAKGTFYI